MGVVDTLTEIDCTYRSTVRTYPHVESVLKTSVNFDLDRNGIFVLGTWSLCSEEQYLHQYGLFLSASCRYGELLMSSISSIKLENRDSVWMDIQQKEFRLAIVVLWLLFCCNLVKTAPFSLRFGLL